MIREPLLAQVAPTRAFRERITSQLFRGQSEQDLPAVGNRPQPGAAINGHAVVVARPQVRLTRVQGHPHP